MSRRFVIVGGGPAGLAAGIEARLAGAEAVVVDRCAIPVDKACGEGLMPAGVQHLARLRVSIPGAHSHPFRGIRYIDGTRSPAVVAEADFRHGLGLGVRRTALSLALRERAETLGVEVRDRTEALGIEAGGAGVRLTTSGGVIAGDWLLGADGLHSQVRKWAGVATETGPARRLGIRRHYRRGAGWDPAWSERVEVWWADGVEAYVTPVGPDDVGVAFLWSASRGRGDLELFLGMFPALAARLGEPTSAVRGAGPFDVRVSTQRAGPVLLLGDAAGYVDALTGEGLALGFEQAEAVVRLCLAGQAEAWPRVWTRLTRRHRWFTRLLLQMAARPWARRLVVRGLAAVPIAFDLGLNAGAARPALRG